MNEWRVVVSPAYEVSLKEIEADFPLRLEAARSNGFLPNPDRAIITGQWERFESLLQKVETLSSTDEDLRLLDGLSAAENYYSLSPWLSEFTAYFALDVASDALVALCLIDNEVSDRDLLLLLERALKDYREKNAQSDR